VVSKSRLLKNDEQGKNDPEAEEEAERKKSDSPDVEAYLAPLGDVDSSEGRVFRVSFFVDLSEGLNLFPCPLEGVVAERNVKHNE